MLAAAALVAVRHSAILLGPGASTSVLSGLPPIGIYVLFAVSGYLVAGSWHRRPRTGRYLLERAVRIFPGFIAVVLATVFLVGPLTSEFALDAYLTSPSTWDYLLNLAMNPQYALPGVFWHNPWSSAVNGVFWSIPAQVFAYLLVPVVGIVRQGTARGIAWLVLAAVAGLASLLSATADVVVWGNALGLVCGILPCFFVGAALKELPWTPNAWFGIPALGAFVVVTVLTPEPLPLADWLLLPVAAIGIGQASFPVIRSAGRWGNPSFGIFLTGFLIQQVLIAGFGTTTAWVSLVATLLLSFAFGAMLLRAVEQPAIRFVQRWTRPAAPEPVLEPAPHEDASERVPAGASAQVAADRRG